MSTDIEAARALCLKRRSESEARARQLGVDPDKVAMLEDIPDACDSCKKVAWVGALDRSKWTCYKCGRSNRRSPPLRPPSLEDHR